VGTMTICRGACHPLFVFEIGLSVDLDACERQLQEPAGRQEIRHRGRGTHFFQYRPAPLRISQQTGDMQIGAYRTRPEVDLVLYDFGAVSARYRIPIEGPLESLVDLSLTLRTNPDLFADARRRVAELIGRLRSAIVKPRVDETAEDYLVFQLEEVTGNHDALSFCADHAATIAQVLRGERGPLSPEEIRDATDARISFGVHDVTIVDWDAALVLDPDPEEVRAVLEVANVQLLEMRLLDTQVDRALERSYDLMARAGRSSWRMPASLNVDLNQVAELQVESAVLLERVTNALKFFGEEYLTRIYRLVADRFHLADWDASITRKLETIERLYEKLADRAAGRRMELLEWVVIILIALEIVLSLVPGLRGR
jgi:hypothetical protein